MWVFLVQWIVVGLIVVWISIRISFPEDDDSDPD